MEINNDDYGGFIVSNNVINGYPIKYSYRKEPSINQLNDWIIYSTIDDEDYINDSNNFTILNADSISQLSPVMLAIFSAPYGADLCWLYEDDVHIGFYDLNNDKEVSISEILGEY